jgi:ABC-type dipeptide/oligopeptide/nickel transport system permease component
MRAFLIRRAVLGIITLWAIVTITFFMIRLIPGDPFQNDKNVPRFVLEAHHKKYGFDKPKILQYLNYLKNLVLLDFGHSTKYENWSVGEILRMSLPVSAFIGFFALSIAIYVGVTSGAIAGVYRGSLLDYVTMMVVVLGICVPNFVIAPLVALGFGFIIPVCAPAGWRDLGSLILPALVLSLPYIAYISRLTRAGMLEILGKDYIRTARAKGLPDRRVIFEHALRNSIIPVVTFLGPAAAGILTGSFVIEFLFNIPGIGIQFVNSIQNRDYPLILGIITVTSGLLILFNLLVDLSYTLINPRVKL